MSDQNRRTPSWFFQLLQKEVIKSKFTLDAFANKKNALCKRFIDEKTNALVVKWSGKPFYNPPFKLMGLAIEKAFNESKERNIITCGVGPTGCSQKWFHNFAKKGTIYVPDERIAFFDSKTGKPTPGGDRDTMVYLFGPGFWNKSNTFKVLPLHVRGLVVRAPAKKKAPTRRKK